MGRVWWRLGNLSKVLQALGSEFRFAGLGSQDLETHIVLEAPLDMFDSHIRAQEGLGQIPLKRTIQIPNT